MKNDFKRRDFSEGPQGSVAFAQKKIEFWTYRVGELKAEADPKKKLEHKIAQLQKNLQELQPGKTSV